MSRWVNGLVAIGLLTGCGGFVRETVPSRADGPVLFEGARLIIGDGTVVENGAMLVQGERIASLGAAGELTVPPGSRRVDLQGRTVIPALIDAHAHVGYEGYTGWGGQHYTLENVADHLDRYAYYGFGAVFSAGTDPPGVARRLERERARGERKGARLLVAAGMGPPGQGPNPQMLASMAVLGESILHGVSTEAEARTAVRRVARTPTRFIKIWVDDRNGAQEKLKPPVFTAVIEEAGRHGLPVFVHQQNARDMHDLLDAGVSGFLHGRLGPDLEDALAARIAGAGAFLVPNLGLGERGRHGEAADPFLLETLSEPAARRFAASAAARPVAPPDAAAGARERSLREAFQRLLDHGVDIVLGTDAGAVPDHFFGYTGHVELEIFVRLGMTPMQALVAATSRPAAHLGLHDLGMLAPGMSADFVVLAANPLDDIRNTRRIEEVFLRGERVDREALRRRFTGG